MTHKIGILLLASTAMVLPAAAQNAPNPGQAAAKQLLQAADNAMYRVKESGKNGIQAAVDPTDT